MNNFTSLEQSKLLLVAGFPQNRSIWKWLLFQEIDGSRKEWLLCKRHLNCWWHVSDASTIPCMFTDTSAIEIIDAVSADDIMYFIWQMNCYLEIGFDDLIRVSAFFSPGIEYEMYGKDLMSVLVDIYVKIKQESECR